MKLPITIILGFFVAFAVIAGGKPLKSVSTDNLISQLTEESNQGIGSHTTAWADGFMAINDEPSFHGGIIGSVKPVTSPVMRELVRRGCAALPKLIDHLTDARPTKLIVGSGFSGKWFSDEYAPRYSDPKKQPEKVNADELGKEPRPEQYFKEYTLKVGDLCFVAIGQIINRQFNAVRYQPSMCLVVNSPLEKPVLATAVKADWSKLTPQEHMQSLILDINCSDDYLPVEALKRLWFYYPKTGENWILKMMQRPLYDQDFTYNFFTQKLVRAKNADEAANLLRDFKAAHGETNYLGVLKWLIWASTFPENQMDARRHKNKEVADKLLNRAFTNFDPQHPPFLNAATHSDQNRILEGMTAIHFPALDEAVFQLLQQIPLLSLNHNDVTEQYSRCYHALNCVQRLAGQDKYEAGCRAAMNQLFAEYQSLSKAQNNPAATAYFDQQIETLKQTLDKILEKKIKTVFLHQQLTSEITLI